jgi:hypothetical protein
MKLPRALWIMSLLTLVVAAAFAVDLTPWLRGGFGWRWQYAPAFDARALPLLLVAVVYVAGGVWLLGRRPRGLLLWALAGAVALSVAAAHTRSGDALGLLFERTASLVASGEHPAAALIDWGGGEWRDWTAAMAAYSGNLGTSPPGMFMLYALTAGLFEATPGAVDALYRTLLPYQCHNYDLLALAPAWWAAAWFGILTPLFAALGVLPLRSITRRAAGARAADMAVLWYPLIPGMAAFATSSSTLFALLALVTFDLLARGLDRGGLTRRGALWLTGAGVAYGLGLFLNFVFLPLAAFYGLYALAQHFAVARQTGRPVAALIAGGGWALIGAVVPWALFTLATGQTFFDLLAQSLAYHLQLDRPYAFWVWFHVWDWAVWTGLLWVLLAAWGLRRSLRASSAPPLIAIALGLAVLALTLSGTTRGESGRVWLFLSPFALIAAADALARWLPPGSGVMRRAAALVAGAQAVLAVALLLAVDAYPAPDMTPPPAQTALVVTQTADARFTDRGSGAQFRLTGWDVDRSGDSPALVLRWEGITRALTPHWFGALLIAPDGAAVPVEAWQPRQADGMDARLPTTCWAAGVTVWDRVPLALDAAALSGDWWISLAAFGDPTQSEGRLTVTTAAGDDVQVGLGPLTFP